MLPLYLVEVIVDPAECGGELTLAVRAAHCRWWKAIVENWLGGGKAVMAFIDPDSVC